MPCCAWSCARVSRTDGDYKALLGLPAAKIEQTTTFAAKGDVCTATVVVANRSRSVAPFLRLNLLGADGEQILPADYSDNYFNLLPSERRTITITWKKEDGRGQAPRVNIEPINATD